MNPFEDFDKLHTLDMFSVVYVFYPLHLCRTYVKLKKGWTDFDLRVLSEYEQQEVVDSDDYIVLFHGEYDD